MALEASSLVQRLNKEPAVLCNKYIRCVCVCVCVAETHWAVAQQTYHLFNVLHPINSPSTADRVCSGTTHDITHYSLLFLSCEPFPPRVYDAECAHLLACCMYVLHVCVCVSNDAVGHDRRWHLLLMVTPAQGRPCSRAPGKEKLEGGGGGH